MRILLAAATEAELKPTRDWLQSRSQPAGSRNAIGACITGVGMLAATYELTAALCSSNWDFVLGAGIAGAFSRELELCDCVVVETEQVADFGAEDGEEFLDAFSMELVKANRSPYVHRLMHNALVTPPFPINHLKKVAGLTVNKVSGHEPTIAWRTAHYGANVESMEGAALHYVCLKRGTPFLQLRAISNYVTRRNRDSWKIKDAINALNEQLLDWLKPLVEL